MSADRIGRPVAGEPRIQLVVSLYVEPGHEDLFQEFESRAAPIMHAHGGRIEKAIRPTTSAAGGPLPYEIHLVSFPSMEGLAAYRSDPLLAALADLRERAIARTTIVVGDEVERPEAIAADRGESPRREARDRIG